MTGNLSGCWTFNATGLDYGTGNSVYDHFTSYTGNPVWSTSGYVGVTTSSYKSIDLDGDDMRTSSGKTFMSADRKSVSVAFWVAPRANYSSITHIMMCSDFSISQSSNNYINFSISVPSTNSVVVPVTVNAWTHIVGTYDGSTIRVYKNGQLYTSKAWAGTVSNPGRYLTVGGWTSGVWNGLLDDLRIYSRVLIGDEVYGLYNWRQTD